MQRDLVNPIDDLFDAAARHRTIRLDCPRCRRTTIYDGHAVWWLFERRKWPSKIPAVRWRFYCGGCFRESGTRSRPRISLSHENPNSQALPMPDERDWKRALSRRR